MGGVLPPPVTLIRFQLRIVGQTSPIWVWAGRIPAIGETVIDAEENSRMVTAVEWAPKGGKLETGSTLLAYVVAR